jgi:hypothetical protein
VQRPELLRGGVDRLLHLPRVGHVGSHEPNGLAKLAFELGPAFANVANYYVCAVAGELCNARRTQPRTAAAYQKRSSMYVHRRQWLQPSDADILEAATNPLRPGFLRP